jgi:type IV pilus assembly protein PilA
VNERAGHGASLAHTIGIVRARRITRGAAGFTIVELMVVVGILGVLAAIAVVSYARYAQRAHVSEAYNMLGMIRMRQESYRSEFSQYCDVAGNSGTTGAVGTYFPDGVTPGRQAAPWTGNAALAQRWAQLGINPTHAVYYRYDSPAGNPGVAPAFGSGLGYSSAPNQDYWWAAHAYGNLDGDSVRSTFEAFSMTNGVWVSNETE